MASSAASPTKRKRRNPHPESPPAASSSGAAATSSGAAATSSGGAAPKRPKHGGGAAPWLRLDLILSLQAKDLALDRKIDLAFDFVKSLPSDSADDGHNPVPIPRIASFLAEWVQSILIPPNNSGLAHPCLNSRCWDILKHSIQTSSSAAVSPNLLRAVARLSQDDSGVSLEHAFACISAVLSTNPRAFGSASPDLWVSCGAEMVALARDNALLSLPTVMLEQFSDFLKFNTNPKKVFPVFVDRLLEPMLELLALLHSRVSVGRLVKAVEDVLKNGLFHRAHLSGFFGLGSLGAKEVKGVNESYHRHLFKKMKKIVAEKKAEAICGSGYLFGLFVAKSKTREGKGPGSEVSDQAQETSKSLFEVFKLFMEPLLVECRRLVKMESVEMGEDTEVRMEQVRCVLSSMNVMLLSFLDGKVYSRMEDTLDGVHVKYLKEVYETIISVANEMYMFWTSRLATSDEFVKKILPLIGREVVVAVGYFLEIEYKVLGEDLVKFWLLLFSYLAAYLSYEEEKPSSLLPSDIMKLGCRLIHVYSEIRQVGCPIFAMCRAVRLFGTAGDVGTVGVSFFFLAKPLSGKTCLQAARAFVRSQELQFCISNAIKSIPEGQASGCIQQLDIDISDSLEWIGVASSEVAGKFLDETNSTNTSVLYLDWQAELLGRFLSEIYAILLDSVTVTATNSVLINNSIKNLMQKLSPSFSNLVDKQSGNIDGFFSSVTGLTVSTCETKTVLFAMSWIFVFFFRMYSSCRGLYKKTVRLMPPGSSRKASVAMGSLLTVSCGMDRIEKPVSLDEGYFSWIVKPSISLPEVIKLLSDDYLLKSSAGYTHLVYLIHVMALERLSDLNRQIKAIEFSEEWDARQVQLQSSNCADNEKPNGKLKTLVTMSRKEAKELINFMTGYLQLPASGWQQVGAIETKKMLSANKDTWDFGFCSLDEASLPTALWWLLCENIDIWSVHAGNKNMKKILNHLLCRFLPCGRDFKDFRDQGLSRPFSQKATTHYSVNVLTGIYEQTVFYKDFGSQFFRILKELLSPMLVQSCAGKIDLDSLPDWLAMLAIFEKGPRLNIGDMLTVHGHSSLSESDLVLSNMCHAKQSERQPLPSAIVDFMACENLLRFVSQMVGVLVTHESFALFTTYVVNLERLLVSNVLSHQAESCRYNTDDTLSLLLSCRKVMKFMVMTSFQGTPGSSFFADVFNDSSSVLWLFKSVSETVGQDYKFFSGWNPHQLKEIAFPLMSHTSSIFFTISKFSMSCLISQKSNTGEQDVLVNADQQYASSVYFDAWKYVDLVLNTLKNTLQGVKLETCTSVNWNNLSFVISCFQGFVWGLTSGLVGMDSNCSREAANNMGRLCFSKLNDCIAIFEDLERRCLNMLLIDVSQETDILASEPKLPESDYIKYPSSEIENSSKYHPRSERPKYSSYCGDGCNYDSGHHQVSNSKAQGSSFAFADSIVSNLSELSNLDASKMENLKRTFLKGLLKGESPHIAFTLRELFMASAAILNLKCLLSSFGDVQGDSVQVQLASSSTGILLGTSRLVLLEMSEMVGRPDPFCFVWLDGILKYLEVLGSNISSANLTLSRDTYALLIDTHLRVIGKCISLQGKVAFLSSYEIGSNTKMLLPQKGPSSSNMLFAEQNYSIDVFKARLRMSFRKLIWRPSKFHLKAVIHALERALIGVQQNLSMVYEIKFGDSDGGNVSSVVAGGIDCLDLVLESISGQMHVLEKNIPNLIDAIFNIVLHLRSPTIFFLEKLYNDESKIKPDSGSIILMCIEVLTKVAGRRVAEKHSFDMSPHQISQCLHVPGALFQTFHQLGVSCVAHSSSIFFDNQNMKSRESMLQSIVDRQLSVNLYASCCKLLCTALKHQKCKVEGCIALLEDSVTTLLSCLETVNASLVSKRGYLAWELEDAIKCASFLRRIYEEIRQQKDVLGRFSYYFLSTYISIYSGCGPLKTSIKREVDEALRPGVYSLIDICTDADLQLLHTTMGEGPCRSTLATLLNDYRLNFQYEGKV